MNIQLKEVEKLNTICENFFAGLGYDEIECKLDTDFAYYHGSDLITYTLIELPFAEIGLKGYLEKNYPFMPKCSMFIFSLLHELGHYLTVDKIKRKKWLHCQKTKKILDRKVQKIYDDNIMIEKQMFYCTIYDERIATKKAVNLLIENYDFIIEYEKVLNNAICDFYRKNNITNT